MRVWSRSLGQALLLLSLGCEANKSISDSNAPVNCGDIEPTVWFGDVDGDGYGDPELTREACEQPEDYVSTAEDCDDLDAAVHPGATPSCTVGVDRDCDELDDGEARALWTDEDGDVFDWTETLAAGTADSPALMALDEAGELSLCPGVWYVSLELQASVKISGRDEGLSAALSGGGAWTPVTISDGAAVEMSWLTVMEGYADGDDGGGITCIDGATLSMHQMFLYRNTGRYGAALHVDDCDATLEDVAISENEGVYSGGVYANDADIELVDVVAQDNYAETAGGTVTMYGGVLTMIGGQFLGNSTYEHSACGALDIYNATATIDGTEFSNNSAGSGGAMCIDRSKAEIQDSVIQDNVAISTDGMTSIAGRGGAIYAYYSEVEIHDTVMTNNVAVGAGGSVYVWGARSVLTITDSTLQGCTAGDAGGGVYIIVDDDERLELSLSNVNFTENSPDDLYLELPDDNVTIDEAGEGYTLSCTKNGCDDAR